MTRHQGGDDGDDMVPFDDVGANDGDDVHGDGASKKKKKGTKAKTDKAKDKKPAKPVDDFYEGYMITVLDQIKDGENPSWIKTRKTTLPVASKELRDQAIAHQKATGYNMSGQFQKLSSSQQTIVNRLVDEKNANEKDSNAQWVLFGVKRVFQEERRSAFRSMKVNRAMRVTIKRQDKAKNAVKESNSGAVYAGEDIIDISKPVKAPKKDTAAGEEKEEKKKKKKPKKVSDPEEDYQGKWTDVPEGPDPNQGDFYNQYPPPPPPNQPQEPYDPAWNMQDPQGPIPVPQQFADQRIPPPVPMPPHNFPRQHQQPQGNPFQPRPDVWPQPVPNEVPLEGFPDRHPRGASAHGARPSARHPSQSRSREDINRANHRRRDSFENEKLRQFEAKLERNSDKMDEIVDMVRMAAATKKVNDWPTNSPPSSDYSRSTFHDDIWTDGSGGRECATPATSPDRDRTRKYAGRPPMGSLQRRNTFSPGPGKRYYEDRRRAGYREPHYTVEPGVSHRAGRDRLRDPRVVVDDYPGNQPRYVERPRAQRRVTHHAEGLPRARFAEDRNRFEVVYDEPANGRRGGGRYHRD